MPPPETRPSIRSNRAVSTDHFRDSPHVSPRRELSGFDFGSSRPGVNRTTTFEGPTQLKRDSSPVGLPRMSRVPSDNLTVRAQRAQLRPINKVNTANDVFEDPSDESTFNSNSSPDRYYDGRSASPATSHGSEPRNVSSSSMNGGFTNGKKQPPPPPPSRSKKPPPPPPMKRSALSTSNVPYA